MFLLHTCHPERSEGSCVADKRQLSSLDKRTEERLLSTLLDVGFPYKNHMFDLFCWRLVWNHCCPTNLVKRTYSVSASLSLRYSMLYAFLGYIYTHIINTQGAAAAPLCPGLCTHCPFMALERLSAILPLFLPRHCCHAHAAHGFRQPFQRHKRAMST